MPVPSRSPRLTLEDLIDLEMQLQADRDRDSQELRRRDAEIGQAIDARRLAEEGRDREMFLLWLRRLQRQADPHQPSPGRQVGLLLEVVGLALVIFGLSLGLGVVAGWLRMSPAEPVNAIFFWSVVVGVQVLLLGVWLVAVLPTSWLRIVPGAEAFQMLLRLVARALPLAAAWAAARLSPEHRLLLARVRGTLQSWSWVYGRIRFWKLVSLTQMFAVAYNVGAILAFVAISYGHDPAFGWRSRLLTPEELHAVVQTIAWPWNDFWPAAAPTLEDIQITRTSSLAPRFAEAFEDRSPAPDAWALWWPFLMACLLFYGLLPRLATLAISVWRTRRALAAVKLDHGDFFKLRDRLTRPLVETQATAPEVGAEEPPTPRPRRRGVAPVPRRRSVAEAVQEIVEEPKASEAGPSSSDRGYEGVEATSDAAAAETPAQPSEPAGPAPPPTPPVAAPSRLPVRNVVKWAGVNLEPEEVGRLVRQRLHVEPAAVHTVGDLEGKGDEATLAALENDGQGEVLMVVESWEPPIADYVDFLSDLRQAVGRERMIVILLYNRDPQGHPVPPRPQDAQVWRDQIATLGDPWLCVEELVEGGKVGG